VTAVDAEVWVVDGEVLELVGPDEVVGLEPDDDEDDEDEDDDDADDDDADDDDADEDEDADEDDEDEDDEDEDDEDEDDADEDDEAIGSSDQIALVLDDVEDIEPDETL
jgi:hypothetical protein